MMLEKRTYTRQELIDIFKTDRFDSIKAKLKRQGYEFISAGRKDTATVTITKQPLRFRRFCIDELDFAPQTDFKRLKKFMYRFFFEEDYQALPLSTMALESTNGTNSSGKEMLEFDITYQTLSSWISKMIGADLIWRDFAEFNYYLHTRDKNNRKPITIPIDKERYSEAWRRYWLGKEESWSRAIWEMEKYAGGTPQKVGKIEENAYGTKKLNELKQILKEEIDIDE